MRHGHATAAATLETLYANTVVRFGLIYADIASPPPVASYLRDFAATHTGFTHLRFDDLVSRQTARRRALELVTSPFVVLLDNNMLCAPGWLENLLQARAETGASLVSPIIVSQGGRIHFSGGKVVRKRRYFVGPHRVLRPQDQAGAPVLSYVSEAQPRRVEIDFAESHCCLVATEDLRLPGVLEEQTCNAHTTCYASYRLKHSYGKRLILEPSAVASILPIGFGYDLAWICGCYMRPDLLARSYRLVASLIGVGPGTDARSGFEWHAKHLKYLLLTMLEGTRFDRQDLLALDEIPVSVRGYDLPLPPEADGRIRDLLLPRVAGRFPDFVEPLMYWLGPNPPVPSAG